MIFVTVDPNSKRSRALTCILAKAFPGSTIHEKMKIVDAAEFSVMNQVDAVVAYNAYGDDLDELMEYIRMKKNELPVYVLQEEYETKMYDRTISWPLTVEKARQNIINP